MSHLANWFKDPQQILNSQELQLLKDFIDGKIKPGYIAKSLTKNIRINRYYSNEIYRISEAILSLAIFSFDSTIQKELVKLLSAIRNLRKRLLNQRKKPSPSNILSEINEIIEDWWSCEYLYFLIISFLILDTKY